jgi:hypothetical protein
MNLSSLIRNRRDKWLPLPRQILKNKFTQVGLEKFFVIQCGNNRRGIMESRRGSTAASPPVRHITLVGKPSTCTGI